MAAFGEVIQSEPIDEQIQTQQAQVSEEVIALDDPRLLSSENVETNEHGDAYAVAPPLPDGKWLAKLTLSQIKDAKGQPVDVKTAMAHWKTPPVPYFVSDVKAKVLDNTGKHDGVELTDYYVKSLVGDRGPGAGTSPMATITRMSGGKVPAGSSQSQTKDAFLQHLRSEPSVVIQTEWQAACRACDDKAKNAGEKAPGVFLRGMERFPQPKAGVYEPEVKCPKCGGMARAQARIRQYFPASTPHR